MLTRVNHGSYLKDSSQPETSKQIFRIAISNLHVREKDQRLG